MWILHEQTVNSTKNVNLKASFTAKWVPNGTNVYLVDIFRGVAVGRMRVPLCCSLFNRCDPHIRFNRPINLQAVISCWHLVENINVAKTKQQAGYLCRLSRGNDNFFTTGSSAHHLTSCGQKLLWEGKNIFPSLFLLPQIFVEAHRFVKLTNRNNFTPAFSCRWPQLKVP